MKFKMMLRNSYSERGDILSDLEKEKIIREFLEKREKVSGGLYSRELLYGYKDAVALFGYMIVNPDKLDPIYASHEDYEFECHCGNTASGSGFYPCDEIGDYCEPLPDWCGLYKCDSCEQLIMFE
ncbi:hypothetical protein [Cytobacillus sp. IB215665]|uniref:hypothetical protein n=1 Tax=Cytobacillus sp. IB215665 TaxID=3097357 RepID=UPI002A0CA006|nr:hypothetical protein [Cytobacillus sp. IB215665]MDX8367691.1 hypothetical protein [Cytobacillus sp. IB215665]